MCLIPIMACSDLAQDTTQLSTLSTSPTTSVEEVAPSYPADVEVEPTASPSVSSSATTPTRLRVKVIEKKGHTNSAFTQGLEFHDGELYESRGRKTESGISVIDQHDGSVVRWMPLNDQYFGEGITMVGDLLIQLTWMAGKAFIYDIKTFTQTGTFDYDGQGWGLCFDGTALIMSDGSSSLTVRDPETFTIQRKITVKNSGVEVPFLNELECAKDRVYANVWQTNNIVEIDVSTGDVTAVIDASGLLSDEEKVGVDVLNGIAYNQTSGTFFLTGKLWPAMFEVTFEPM